MKMLTLKTTAATLIAALLSTNVYAMFSDERAPRQPVRAAVQHGTKEEALHKMRTATAMEHAIQNCDVQEFSTLFTQAGNLDPELVNSLFLHAAYSCQEYMTELLLTPENHTQPRRELVVGEYKSNNHNGIKVILLEYLLQQGENLDPMLANMTLDNLKDILPKAAARGKLNVVKCLYKNFNLTPSTFIQELSNESLRASVSGYGHDLADDERKRQQVRNVINELLGMNGNGPTQQAVDSAFRGAISSSANQGDLRLLQIMLLDRKTGKLRTGLRPTNETIKHYRDEALVKNKKITDFLRSLNL